MQVNDRSQNTRSISLIAAVCLVAEIAFAPYIALASGHPNFAFVFCAVIALTLGGKTGVICGFAAGLAFDLCTTGPVGLMAALLTLCAYALGVECRDRLSDDAVATLLPVIVADLSVALCYGIAMLVLGDSSSALDVIIFRVLPTALLTLVAYLPFAWLSGRGRKGPGSSLTGRRGSRYSVPK